MANLAIMTPTPAQAIRFDYNYVTGNPSEPAMAWPPKGGKDGLQRLDGVYLAIVSPVNVAVGGGITTGRPILG